MTSFCVDARWVAGRLVLEQLTPPLQHEGHGVVTMDLPSEEGSASFDA